MSDSDRHRRRRRRSSSHGGSRSSSRRSSSKRPSQRRPFRWLVRLCVAGLVLGLLGLAGAVLVTQYLFQEPAYVTWARYLKPEIAWQRKQHPSLGPLFDLAAPLLSRTDPRDRFVALVPQPALPDPASWNGQLVGPLPATEAPPAVAGDTVQVATPEALKAAIAAAQPGTVIELQPGLYQFTGRSIAVDRPGQPDRPIVVRGAAPGSVRLDFALLEGFHVRAPYWVFENLVITGTCATDGGCEHAFHVVGGASHTVIRNNWVSDFNAAVKINEDRGVFPDDGIIANNVFTAARPRNTGNPVTVIDSVAASGWVVRRNLIADFAKAGGDRVSYGAFFKGAGENNVFEQNVVRCEWRHAGGTRIGFSFGGGGSGGTHCRDGVCAVEHSGGIARNNIIMDCPNDVGIYLNRSAGTRIYNNALVNTRGIDVRFAGSDAVIANNIIDGRILARAGGVYQRSGNIISPLKALFLGKVSTAVYADPGAGDFRLRDPQAVQRRSVGIDAQAHDLCGQAYDTGRGDIGPIQYRAGAACVPRLQ